MKIYIKENNNKISISLKNKDNTTPCKAWELSKKFCDIDSIKAKHTLEYMSNMEADRALADWLRVLKTGGKIHLTLTNADFYMKQWLKAKWTEQTLKNDNSLAKIAFKELFGSQENCDPITKEYNNKYLHVKKSAYNKSRIKLLLKRRDYKKICIKEDGENLIVHATKVVNNSERQTAKTLDEIRLDHKKRYMFASCHIEKKDSVIIDAASGVGYGSLIMSKNKNIKKIYTLDISQEALKHAQKYFLNQKSIYQKFNLDKDDFAFEKVDYFVSFETIEHLHFYEKFIKKVHFALKDGGVFIGSVPNENIMPYSPINFLYHVRHFTNNELVNLLEKQGFKDIKLYGQKREEPSDVTENIEENYTIFIAKKCQEI